MGMVQSIMGNVPVPGGGGVPGLPGGLPGLPAGSLPAGGGTAPPAGGGGFFGFDFGQFFPF